MSSQRPVMWAQDIDPQPCPITQAERDVMAAAGVLMLDTIINADCMDPEAGLPSLPDGCVDAVVTDPPYGVTSEPWDCLFAQEWLDEMLRISTGPVSCMNAARPDVVRHMMNLDPVAERIIVWRQCKVTPSHGMFWSWQPIYTWRLHSTGWDTVQHAIPAEYVHTTQKPVALMCDLIARATDDGGTILDPFMGSGTTAVACIETGRHFLGYEISADYCAIAEQRIAEARARPRLPMDDAPTAETVPLDFAGV